MTGARQEGWVTGQDRQEGWVTGQDRQNIQGNQGVVVHQALGAEVPSSNTASPTVHNPCPKTENIRAETITRTLKMLTLHSHRSVKIV